MLAVFLCFFVSHADIDALGQAIILCVRPIVLQRVRLVVSAAREESETQPQDMCPSVARFCQTANEAAVKSLLILGELQRKEMLRKSSFQTTQQLLLPTRQFKDSHD